jgi:hypothetical protein
MLYKKKLIVLLSLIAALALTYTASLVFDPELAGTRSASYVWLDSRFVGRVSRIVISTAGQNMDLLKKDSQWFVSHNNREYPARQLRVEDFLGIFTQRAAWPVRSSSAASHSHLGLDTETASRVTLYGENSALLDLLFGAEDSTGREINVRKYGQNEVRSGDNTIASYISSSENSWYNLRLIPESEDGKIAVDSVQRLSVYGEGEPQFFSRRNREWAISGFEAANPDQSSIDAYVRAIINTEGEDFSDVSADAPELGHSRIVLELGNGSIRTIRLSGPDESGRRLAHASGSDYVYLLAPWAAQRLFKSSGDFERQ